MMKRRNFLGLLGGTVAAGPKVAKDAIEGPRILELANVDLGSDYSSPPREDKVGWAKKVLKGFLGRTEYEKEHRRKNWHVHKLHPDIHSLRSVSLSSKMRLQRDYEFHRHEKAREDFLNAVIMGKITYDNEDYW